MTSLVAAEHDGISLPPSISRAIKAALEIRFFRDEGFDLLVAGDGVIAIAQAAMNHEGEPPRILN